MRQNQLMQEENRSLRAKVQSLQEENVWASSEIDRMHWENQAARVEMQWMWNRLQQFPAVESKTYAQTLGSGDMDTVPCESKATYAQTLRSEEDEDRHKSGGERCIRHEPIMNREKRQCKCCVLEAIYKLMLSAPHLTPDLGEFVAMNLVNIPPFINFWCPGCIREFVNKTSWNDLELTLYLIGHTEWKGPSMAEVKQHLKKANLRQRVKCALHFKS